jgi:uncharacterized protein YrrD
MEFKQNAAIVTSNGDAVGHIYRVVVDPETKVVTHIVVRKGFLFKEDKVVPISLIAEATDEQIKLRDDVGDLHALPLFEEKHYVMSGDSGGSVITQPIAGMPGSYVTEPREKYIKQVERHIPAGTVALKEGAKVVDADGKSVGSVERVITAPDAADHATHLLVSKGLLSKEKKLIPITWVTIVADDEVQLTVEPSKLDELEAVAN